MNVDLAAWIAPFAPAGEMNVATLVQTEPRREWGRLCCWFTARLAEREHIGLGAGAEEGDL